MHYRYILEHYKGMNSRYTCPGCGKRKTFTRYLDTQTGSHLGEEVGKCNREVNCSYHFTPKQYFEANQKIYENVRKPDFLPTKRGMNIMNPAIQTEQKLISFITLPVFKESLKHHAKNNLVRFFLKQFGAEVTSQLIGRYFIGTSKHWDGATVFWQIDDNGKVRTGKIMLYNPSTGKRSKEDNHSPNWVHKVLNLPEFNLKQCFFGEHLLRDKTKPVAICESEKTAIIASAYLPQFIWLACGSLTGLNIDKCQVLSNRKVVLFPDLKVLDKWQVKAKELSHIASFAVSDLLERKATASEKEQGLDLADYLLQFPLQAFNTKAVYIQSVDIISILGEMYTGSEFNNLIIVGIKTKESKVYDLLFDKSKEIIQPNIQDEAVKKLASFYEKNFSTAFFDDIPCLIHMDN